MNDIHASKKSTLTYILVVLIVILILAVSILRKNQSIEIKYTQLLMGTVVDITLYGNDEQLLKLASDAGFAEIKRLEALMSHYKEDSDVSRINRYAGKNTVTVSPETIEVIETAKKISEISSGAFDITMGVFGKAWRFTKDDNAGPIPPAKKDVEPLLTLIDYKQIIIDKITGTVKLGKEGMRINLGGIAKGYIVSKAVGAIKTKGIKKGIVHAGGDMFIFNEIDNKPFKIGIQHPREKDKVIGTIDIFNGAVATSGDYERFFIKDGIRYHHIMDPKTGFPASKVRAVTIVADNGTMADALSTAVFVMGLEDGMNLIEKLPDIQGLIIDENGNVHQSKGLKNAFK